MKRNPFMLLQTATDSCRLLWRLGLRRLGLIPLKFDPKHRADQRLEKLLLFRRYGQQLATLDPAEFGWKQTASGTWVFLIPGNFGAIWNDPDLPHVRRGHFHGNRSADSQVSAKTPAKTGTAGAERDLWHCPNCQHRVLKIHPGRRCPYCQQPFPSP